jgi:hypothetical protein
VACLGIFVLVGAGCGILPVSDPGLVDGVSVRNETRSTLSFKMLVTGKWYDLPAKARPRDSALVLDRGHLASNSVLARDGCAIGDLVAFGPDGREVARHAPPLCKNDVWVITEADLTLSPSP